jgi:hypothetical protein
MTHSWFASQGRSKEDRHDPLDTLFLPDEERKKTDKKWETGGNLSRKIICGSRKDFFESLALADRNHNFLEHTVGHEFES